MANHVTPAWLDAQMRHLSARTPGKRFRSEDDIRIQLMHELRLRVSVKEAELASGNLSKDETSRLQGWIGCLKFMARYLASAEPHLSKDSGWFKPAPLGAAYVHAAFDSLVVDAARAANQSIRSPKENVVWGMFDRSLYSSKGEDRKRAYWHFEAIREGSKAIWAQLTFPDEDYASGGNWDSKEQFLKYADLDPKVVRFLKEEFVHDSHGYQYREGWRTAANKMVWLAGQAKSLAPDDSKFEPDEELDER